MIIILRIDMNSPLQRYYQFLPDPDWHTLMSTLAQPLSVVPLVTLAYTSTSLQRLSFSVVCL